MRLEYFLLFGEFRLISHERNHGCRNKQNGRGRPAFHQAYYQ